LKTYTIPFPDAPYTAPVNPVIVYVFNAGAGEAIFGSVRLPSDYRLGALNFTLVVTWYSQNGATGSVKWNGGLYCNGGYGYGVTFEDVGYVNGTVTTAAGVPTQVMKSEIPITTSFATNDFAQVYFKLLRDAADTQSGPVYLMSVALKYVVGTVA
jgi:hypothetical protein